MLTANCGNLPQGSFRSNDVTLNAIYSLCEQTTISATDDTLTDCPTYEAVNWNFDNRLGAMSDLVTCRNIAVLRNSIEQFARIRSTPRSCVPIVPACGIFASRFSACTGSSSVRSFSTRREIGGFFRMSFPRFSEASRKAAR